MSQPEIVQAALAGEDVVAQVDLGGEDELYVTPTRTLLYRAEGLLSDESVEEYSHDAERITVSEGRRKAKVTLDYGLDGQETISLPAKRLERALQPIVEGVFKANDVLEDDEPMERLFRFSELTIVIASERVVRHIGANLWDEDFESYHYSDVSDLDFEDGSVATSVVLTVNGRQERFKAPNDDARAVRAALETTLLSYWGVDSLEELRAAAESDGEEAESDVADGDQSGEVSFGDGPDPLIADPAEPEELPENATRSGDNAETTPTDAVASGDSADLSTAQAGATDASADGVTQQVERPTQETATETAESSATASSSSTQSTAETTETNDTAWANATQGPTEPETADADSTQAGNHTQSAASEAGSNETPSSNAGFEGSGFQSATPTVEEQLREELAELRETVEQQNEELRAQRELVEQLIEELRRGR
ncbi:DUF7115 domain-containing protein [Halobellus inordinatus]|uniref:DUF7115 domain-containing protein n=1 Tax=Halobellus inordinatus TaxID=1126236 RepID=UPI0021143E20|nr:hypothetical protein [Halobellus ramosii]